MARETTTTQRHGHAHGHGHSHGLVDRSIVRSREGLRAVGLSLLVLLLTALAQAVVFVSTGSVALLADLIHNVGDALTAVPLAIAFLMRSFVAEKRAGYFVVAPPSRAPPPSTASSIRRSSTTSGHSPPPAASGSSATRSPRRSGRTPGDAWRARR
jgi:hypothetical protein